MHFSLALLSAHLQEKNCVGKEILECIVQIVMDARYGGHAELTTLAQNRVALRAVSNQLND